MEAKRWKYLTKRLIWDSSIQEPLISLLTLAKTEIIYPNNVGALVAMNFT